MRYVRRSRNSINGRNFSRLLVAAGGSLVLSACTSLGIGDEAAQPDLTGDSTEEVNWSFADAAKLQTEITQLKSENARLKTEMKALQQSKAKAEAAAIELARNEPSQDTAGADADAVGENDSARATAPTKAVVAAADADRALADAPPPVEEAPRLVQPSFSDEKTVFENEAGSGEIRLSSVLYGVHLASYKTMEKARAGWSELQRAFPDELGLLEPRVERITIPDRGVFLRLIGGGFSSESKASSLCKRMKDEGRYCAVAGFGGQRLSLADASG